MTNTNVMALNVQAASAKAAGGKAGMKGAADGSSKGNFDEALGRLQQEIQKEIASTGKDDTPQSKDNGDGGSGREGAPQNPLAMVMALPVQQQAAVEEMPAEAPAAVVEFTEEAHTQLSGDMIKTSPDISAEDVAPRQDLRSLLPQSDETAVKSKDFLAMLSGDLTSGQRAEAQGRQVLSVQVTQDMQISQDMRGLQDMQASQGMEIPEGMELLNPDIRMTDKPQQGVEARLMNPWQVGQPMAAEEPRDPLGMALRQAQKPLQQATQGQEASQNLQAEAKGPAMAQTAQQTVVAAVSASEMPTARTESWQALMGNNIAVETEPEIQPLRVMHSQESQGEAPFAQQQENRPAAQGNFAAVLESEETATPAQAVPANHSAGATQINTFQQQVEAAAPAPAETPAAPAQAQADYEVPGQIVEQARLIRSGQDTEMVIHLKPEHLGDLTLKISVTENGAVTASFHSDNAQVRTIIENSLVQLRQELNNQGLKVDSVEVFSGLPDGQLPQGQGQQAWQQGSQGRFMGDKKPEDYAEEADDLSAAALAQSQESLADEGVDYRV